MTIIKAGAVPGTNNSQAQAVGTNSATFGHTGYPVRGRITVPEYVAFGMPASYEFLFNPAEVAEQKDVNWGEANVPGASHPVHQFGSGGARKITFDLFLDGDRGKFAYRNKTQSVFTTQDMDEIMSVKPDVLYWQSLQYAMEYGRNQFAKVKPPVVIFNFGNLYKNVVCLVKKADPRWTHFNQRMTPIRATLSVQLDEQIEQSVTGPEFYRQDIPWV